jgi:hypothetical protein
LFDNGNIEHSTPNIEHRIKSGAEARAVSRKAGLARLPDVLGFREAFGVRAVYRRFTLRHDVWTNRICRRNLPQPDLKRPGLGGKWSTQYR